MTKRLALLSTIAGAMLFGAACTVHQDNSAPPLSGPSEFAQSVTVTATPDVISRDGHSQSAIVVRVFDAAGQPAAGVALRMDILVGGSQVDFGSLGARNIVTASDGRATTSYTAPPPPPTTSTAADGTVVAISAIPLGSNGQGSRSYSADITLMPPGVILPNVRFVPGFTVEPAGPTQGTPITFDASSTTDPDNAVVSYAWDFGDGTHGAGRIVTHSYAQVGGVTVTLTVSDALGRAASTTKVVTIGSGTAPTAAFNVSPTQAKVGDTVFFNAAASTAASGRTLVGYHWDFGDGGAADAPLATHVYTVAGTYLATLTVTDDVGRSGATSQSVTIGGGVVADFTISPTSPAHNEEAVFDASASRPSQGQAIVDFAWGFGVDTSVEHTGSPIWYHVYPAAGTFTVNLTITDSAGRTASKTATVTIR